MCGIGTFGRLIDVGSRIDHSGRVVSPVRARIVLLGPDEEPSVRLCRAPVYRPTVKVRVAVVNSLAVAVATRGAASHLSWARRRARADDRISTFVEPCSIVLHSRSRRNVGARRPRTASRLCPPRRVDCRQNMVPTMRLRTRDPNPEAQASCSSRDSRSRGAIGR